MTVIARIAFQYPPKGHKVTVRPQGLSALKDSTLRRGRAYTRVDGQTVSGYLIEDPGWMCFDWMFLPQGKNAHLLNQRYVRVA